MKEITADQICTILRKNSLSDKIADFFPAANRDESTLEELFNKEGMQEIYSYYKKQKNITIKENIGVSLTEMISTSSAADVLIFLTLYLGPCFYSRKNFLEFFARGRICDNFLGLSDGKRR